MFAVPWGMFVDTSPQPRADAHVRQRSSKILRHTYAERVLKRSFPTSLFATSWQRGRGRAVASRAGIRAGGRFLGAPHRRPRPRVLIATRDNGSMEDGNSR